MKVLPDKPTAYFDIDETLVHWIEGDVESEDDTVLLYNGNIQGYVIPNDKNIQQLKNHALRGHPIIVWSQGGAEWAATIIRSLELEEYVTICASKPTWYYDDLEPTLWMGKNMYKARV